MLIGLHHTHDCFASAICLIPTSEFTENIRLLHPAHRTCGVMVVKVNLITSPLPPIALPVYLVQLGSAESGG